MPLFYVATAVKILENPEAFGVSQCEAGDAEEAAEEYVRTWWDPGLGLPNSTVFVRRRVRVEVRPDVYVTLKEKATQ